MELKISSPKHVVSPSDCISDPEEKEISEDDDDDRNHKHRRRETRSESLERDALEQGLTRPYKKRNKPFENGNLYREGNSQIGETWKNYNLASLDKDFPMKFERRRPGLASFSRAPLDSNQRIRMNQSFSGDLGPGRGRGKDTGSWSLRDSRFRSVDIASQMVQHGSVPQTLFAGRAVQNVSSVQSGAWSAFGLVPRIPNGGVDSLHSLGLQGALRPPINPSLNIGMPRQRCRDFEERGFCLRGDMCPMEHGVNRIVVEDVQSLSQFNLPVSLPSTHLLGAPAASGPLPATTGPSSTLMNSKGLHGKSIKTGVSDEDLGLNGAFVGPAVVSGADLYDPDQPLWTNDFPETSSTHIGLNPSNVDENDSVMETDPSGHHCVALGGVSNNENPISSGNAVGSQAASSSVWERIQCSKNRSLMKEKYDSTTSFSNYIGNESKEDHELVTGAHGAPRQGKRISLGGVDLHATGSSLKTQGDTGRNIRKTSQKALRTLFVNGIPLHNNRREALLLHFQKFGEVIDIYIPLNSERAFVQFSNREEAEAALKAPDAVMGNRFIKLWWANRDSIPDDRISGGNSVPITPRGVAVALVPPQSSISNRGKDNLQPATPKNIIAHTSAAPTLASEHQKSMVSDTPRAQPPLQKKLESLELLKELRKKQEMLDQKRNDFRLQLDKLKKQTSGLKGETITEQAAKRHKVGTEADVTNGTAANSSDRGPVASSPKAEMVADNRKSADCVVPHNFKINSVLPLHEHTSLNQSIRPLAPGGAPFVINRYKLDNRPTTFRIVPPLPIGLTNVSILKEHFSAYGDLSTVELDNLETHENDSDSVSSKSSARISFKTRHSAERAFLNGKCWQGHNLQFMWLTSSSSSMDICGRGNTCNVSKEPLDAEVQPAGEAADTDSYEATASRNSACENVEREGTECHDEVLQSSSTTTSCQKQSS